MKQDICRKCNQFFWVEEHHILPKSTFGETDSKVWLCPNCHTDYHQKLGAKNLKNTDAQFHLDFFRSWMMGIICIVLLLVAYWYF